MSSSIDMDNMGGSSSSPKELPTPEKSRNEAASGGGVRFRSRESIEEIRRISRISNYDLEEVINYWGDSNEHKLRKEELRMAVAQMENRRRLSDNMEYTTLGITDRVGEGRALKRAHRMKARNAVLKEQKLQRFEGVVDDEGLAGAYWDATSSARELAESKATNLHKEVAGFS